MPQDHLALFNYALMLEQGGRTAVEYEALVLGLAHDPVRLEPFLINLDRESALVC